MGGLSGVVPPTEVTDFLALGDSMTASNRKIQFTCLTHKKPKGRKVQPSWAGLATQ